MSANHYRAERVPKVRLRTNLIATVTALSSSAVGHYEAWERAVSKSAARRLTQSADSLYPLTVGSNTRCLPRGL